MNVQWSILVMSTLTKDCWLHLQSLKRVSERSESCFWLFFVSRNILSIFCLQYLNINLYSPINGSNTSHTHTQPFNGLLSGTTWIGRCQKKHSPTHTHPDHWTSFIIFLHLQRSMASSLFSLRTWQSSRTTSLQVLFGLPLGPGPSTSYSMPSPNHHNLFAAHAHTNAACFAAIPMLCHLYLVSLSAPYLGVYLFTERHTSTWPFSSLLAEVPPHFLSLQARSHFHATCCFSHNCCTTFLS